MATKKTSLLEGQLTDAVNSANRVAEPDNISKIQFIFSKDMLPHFIIQGLPLVVKF